MSFLRMLLRALWCALLFTGLSCGAASKTEVLDVPSQDIIPDVADLPGQDADTGDQDAAKSDNPDGTDIAEVEPLLLELPVGAPGCSDGYRAWNEYCLDGGQDRFKIAGLDQVQSMDLCDLDKDGFQELVLVRRSPHQLQVYWGSPPEPYRYILFEESFEETDRPYFVRCLDVNSDGHNDVLVSGLGPKFGTWFGDGTGVLTPAPTTTFPTSYYLRTWRWMEKIDFNADGHPDIIGFRDYYEGASRGHAMVLLNKGDHTYSSPRMIASGRDALFVDLDKDEDLDVLVEDPNGNYLQLVIQDTTDPMYPAFVIHDGPDGSGGGPALLAGPSRLPGKILLGARDDLSTVTVEPEGPIFAVDHLATTGQLGMRPWFPRNVDIDLDGYSEVLFSLTGRVRFGLLQERFGRLETGLLMSDAGPSRERVALADLDGDGVLDALFWSAAEQAFRTISLKPEDLSAESPGVILSNVSCDQIMAGDVNGDGYDDLVGVRSDLPIKVFFSDGAGGIADVGLIPIEGSNITGLAVADLNGDGVDEIVAVGTQRLWILRHEFGTQFSVSSQFLPHSVYAIAVANAPDADGDGFADLYVTSATQKVHLYRGDGNFNFELAWSGIHGGDTASVRAGDFTGNGHAGCVTYGSYPKTLTRVFPNHDGLPVAEPVPVSLTTRHLEVGDINGDGRTDLVGGQGGGNVQIAFSTPEMGFLVVERDGDLTDDQTGVAVLDLDGNGVDEVVVPERGELKIVKATFVAGVDFATKPEVVQSLVKRGVQRRLIPADVNGDGAVDIWSIRSGTLFKAILNQP